MTYKTDVNKKEIKKKAEQVQKAIADMKKYKTVAMLDLRKLPDSLFQSLRKKIRENGGLVLVLKKPVVSRVLAANKKLAEKVGECNKPIALIYTNQSAYELNSFFKQNKKTRAAKSGDIAVVDIIVPEGETDLPAGPALSELKAAGLNAQIRAGKIAIVKESTVAKAGEKITDAKVKALQTLSVRPFEVMANLIFGFDGEYIYSRQLLDIGDSINADVANGLSQALNVSLNVNYPTKQNINLLLGSAVKQSINFSLNGNLYSSNSIGQLLSSAIRQGMACESLNKK
ncbi:MAG: 50S ribosomal protein L10 [Candidatus Micrarchaeota archaeon]